MFVLIVFCFESCISFLFPTKELPVETPKTNHKPDKQPIFRINGEMHNMAITSIATDNLKQTLATASLDKTVRIWDINTGSLTKVIRIPIGKGKEGELYATAISPKQKILACAGWTGYEWDQTFSIYFINLNSNKITHLIPGLPSPVSKLLFSKDGNYLAVALKDGYGLRIYNTKNYSLVAMDEDYNQDIYGIDFDIKNRIVTTCFDGYIRLYDNEFDLIAREKSLSELPFSISFSPDGKRIAVGYKESIRVDILSGNRIFIFRSYLSNLHTLNTDGIENGDLSVVEFSKNGKYLYAGGSWQKKGKNLLRKWELTNQSNYKDIKTKVTDNLTQIINPTKNILILSSDSPSFQIIRSSKSSIIKRSDVLPTKHLKDNLMISRNGHEIKLWYNKSTKTPILFSLYEKKIVWDTNYFFKLFSPGIITSQKVMHQVSNWKDNKTPILKNKKIVLEKGDVSRSISISSDEKLFMIGTDKYLHLFDQNIKLLWKTPIPASTYSVNISMDKKLVVAALSDGTIRWYRLKDGRELVALLVLRDLKSWVLFSPSGYYDTNSETAEEFLSWVINTGRKNSSYTIPSFILNRYLRNPQVISYIIDNLNTDHEAVFELGEDYVDISSLIPELLESIKRGEAAFLDIENSNDQQPVARVFSTDMTTDNIVIVSSNKEQPFEIGQKLYVLNNQVRVYMEVTYSTGRVSKCKLLEEDKDMSKVKLNTIVMMDKE